MATELLQPEGALLPIPTSLIKRIAFDVVKSTLYVEKRTAGNPLFLSWKKRNSDAGNPLSIVEMDADQVAKLRTEGLRITNEADADLQVRAHAIDIITTASNYHASDIHFMMRGTHCEIQLAVKSSLRVLCRLTQEEGEALVRSIYQLSTVKEVSFDPLEFQNAQIAGDDIPSITRLTSIRIVRGPCYPVGNGGAFMTMRLQYLPTNNNQHRVDLPALPLPRQPEGEFNLGLRGFSERQMDRLRLLLRSPNGIVIVNGPTGSGKTETLYGDVSPNRRKFRHSHLCSFTWDIFKQTT